MTDDTTVAILLKRIEALEKRLPTTERPKVKKPVNKPLYDKAITALARGNPRLLNQYTVIYDIPKH